MVRASDARSREWPWERARRSGQPSRQGSSHRDALRLPAFVFVHLAALPFALFLLIGKPVTLLKLSGAIEAAHLPVLAALALHLNRTRLPEALRPSRLSVVGTAVSAAFFAAFAVLYLYRLLTGQDG